MNNASPLSRWREIVHPIFWPVFFWNLRGFLRLVRRLREDHPQDGQIAYAVTWWGGIHVEWVFANDAAPAEGWDAPLERCTLRVHLATLDVFNPYLTARAPLSHLGEGPGVRGTALSLRLAGSVEAPLPLIPNPSPAGEGDALCCRHSTALAVGIFPDLSFLNTS